MNKFMIKRHIYFFSKTRDHIRAGSYSTGHEECSRSRTRAVTEHSSPNHDSSIWTALLVQVRCRSLVTPPAPSLRAL